MAAGALFFDDNGRLLLVQPTYKPTWEIPGGVVEAYESPLQACVREVAEELGLEDEQRPYRLWAVDYTPESAEKTESLQFIFDGGVLTAADIAAIRLPAAELASYHFCTLPEAQERLNGRLARRVTQCITHPTRTVYLENQTLVGDRGSGIGDQSAPPDP